MADQNTLKALRSKLGDLEDELDSANEAKAELEQELEELRAKLQASEEKVTALESQRGADATLERLEAEQPDEKGRDSPASCSERQKLEEELRQCRDEAQHQEEAWRTEQRKLEEALKQEKERADSFRLSVEELKRSCEQQVAKEESQAQALRAVEAERRQECQRLQELIQEMESDRDSALERMQRAEQLASQQQQGLQELSRKGSAEVARSESLMKEIEARNGHIAHLQGEAQRLAQAHAEEQRKAQDLQEQLAAYVGTHQELFAKFQAAVEDLDSEKQLTKAMTLEREQLSHALAEERERAAQARQELLEKPQGPAQLAVSDVLISVSFKEAEQPLEVRPWDTDFEEVVCSWLRLVQRSEHLQASLVRYLQHLEKTAPGYPLHQDAKLFEVHEQFADAAF